MGRLRHGGLRSFDEREAEKDLSVRRTRLTTPKLCHGLPSCFFWLHEAICEVRAIFIRKTDLGALGTHLVPCCILRFLLPVPLGVGALLA